MIALRNHSQTVEDAPCPVSPDEFRNGMRRLAGVCSIITSADASGDRTSWVGLTATAVSSVSADPPRILVCVNRSAFAHATIVNSGVLGVNVLAAENGAALAGRFGGAPGPVAEKFEDKKWILGALGVPLLKSCLTNLECVVDEIVTNTTHDIIICNVVQIHCATECNEPLIYFNGSYRLAETYN